MTDRDPRSSDIESVSYNKPHTHIYIHRKLIDRIKVDNVPSRQEKQVVSWKQNEDKE